MFTGPEAGKVLVRHGKSMRELNQESNIISGNRENS